MPYVEIDNGLPPFSLGYLDFQQYLSGSQNFRYFNKGSAIVDPNYADNIQKILLLSDGAISES